MIENISILGSTGSIGTQALDVVDNLGLNVSAVTANTNISVLEEQVRKYKPALAVVFDESKFSDFKQKISDTDTKVSCGMEGLVEAASIDSADLVLNSVVGMVGLQPTLCAINAKKDIALANKETLVAGGSLVMQAVKDNGVNLYPVDSEHSAIFQCLQGSPDSRAVKRLILTASGGPFFGRKLDELRNVTVEQALNHPNWDMGAKITIDSATMMNKGLEIIEASWLFDMPADRIDVVVHRESVIHSMIEYVDNSVIAQLGVPDMRIPIQYAITYPSRVPSPVSQLSLTDYQKLTFFEPDYETFKCLRACKLAIDRGGLCAAAANGANEVANKMFRERKISFLDIGDLVMDAMLEQENIDAKNVEDVLAADRKAREFVLEHIS